MNNDSVIQGISFSSWLFDIYKFNKQALLDLHPAHVLDIAKDIPCKFINRKKSYIKYSEEKGHLCVCVNKNNENHLNVLFVCLFLIKEKIIISSSTKGVG